ncbi:hypothetical protein ACTXT7_013879 [Hymenolepis weldensis]
MYTFQVVKNLKTANVRILNQMRKKNKGYQVNKPSEKLIQLDEYCNFIGQPPVYGVRLINK